MARSSSPLVRAGLGATGLVLPLALAFGLAHEVLAQQSGYGQTMGSSPMEQQLYDSGTGKPSGGSILDSTNPLDLMNKIRRGTAMDDATPPSSAIDQALRELDAQSAPPRPAPGVAPGPATSLLTAP